MLAQACLSAADQEATHYQLVFCRCISEVTRPTCSLKRLLPSSSKRQSCKMTSESRSRRRKESRSVHTHALVFSFEKIWGVKTQALSIAHCVCCFLQHSCQELPYKMAVEYLTSQRSSLSGRFESAEWFIQKFCSCENTHEGPAQSDRPSFQTCHTGIVLR